MKLERFILVVVDSAGVGAMPDAAKWGDAGTHTFAHAVRDSGVHLPNFHRLGIGNLTEIPGHPPVPEPLACHGKAAIASEGKDTTVGHWELMGILTATPFPVYPDGFPPEIVAGFEQRTGLKLLGNYPASGTEIIKDLGEEHVRTGHPIVYTSADSVFQIAAHEEVIPLPRLYEICEISRRMMQGPHCVARIIARPFVGKPGAFTRTANRRDYAVPPPEPNLLSLMEAAGRKVISVGKIGSIFDHCHAGVEIPTKGNAEGIAKTGELIRSGQGDLVFVNLVDFDMLYGHRNDAAGYGAALKELDDALPGWIEALRDGDCLILTADHGCDPSDVSTDHTREYVPILALAKGARKGADLGLRASMADVGQTVAEAFGLRLPFGTSFLAELRP
ncbi:MAG: phosphopentomutase [Acidobacteria bacterium]|nr:phosphopentomutase [Acidobacteriota bacterium]